jgi:energy-dependent translational throttle protein EttA
MTTPAISFENVSVTIGGVRILESVDAQVRRGSATAIIGPNGAGKTTLFRMITGQETPDAGTLRLGETVKLGYVDQNRDALDPEKTVWEEISGGEDELPIGKRTVASRAYASWFNFKGRDQQRRVGSLSGGERNRVHLAKLLKAGSNLLLLDEPTNDLDIQGEEQIMNLIQEIHRSMGITIVLVSHLLNVVFSYVNRVMFLKEKRMRMYDRREALCSRLLSEIYRIPVKVEEVDGRVVIVPQGGSSARC